AIQGRTALGERSGRHDLRPGRGSRQDPFQRGPLCSDLDGFSLHAAVRIPAGCRERLEKLCRYAARPPIVEERLSLLPDGRVSYRLKKRYRDGSTHVVLDPLTFLERLCALVPRPRRKLLTYHGVLAPAAGMRDRVVPKPPLPDDDDGGCHHEGRERERAQPSRSPHADPAESPSAGNPLQRRRQPSVPHAPTKSRRPRQRYSWAELLRRVFLVDVLTCPHCRGKRTLLAAIHDPDSIQRILRHLGLPTEPPEIAPARPPPQSRLPW
ncbi:MAG: transposase, partial [Planctomycetota bacterium]